MCVCGRGTQDDTQVSSLSEKSVCWFVRHRKNEKILVLSKPSVWKNKKSTTHSIRFPPSSKCHCFVDVCCCFGKVSRGEEVRGKYTRKEGANTSSSPKPRGEGFAVLDEI